MNKIEKFLTCTKYYLSINRLKIDEKGYFKYWFLLWNFLLSVIYEVVQNPKFIFSFLVIMLISSAGIWAPWLYSLDLSPVCETIVPTNTIITTTSGGIIQSDKIVESVNVVCLYISSLDITLFQNFSLFMFNLGLLGGIAAEFFIQKKDSSECEKNIISDDLLNDDGSDSRVKEYAAFFLWVVAFILSFFALKNPTGDSPQVFWGGVLSIFLWIFTNIRKKEYIVNTDANNLVGGIVLDSDKLQGMGLDEAAISPEHPVTQLNGDGLE
ncbi:hypothetical protein [Pantoea rwandensis]|uniref:Uncharacterized protein n=1 Tax=Pantoea rwandensis TaxID=1076550 RepID=A0A1X1CVR9_9GAMM|nr:hypothetical protein [Pantoea rwandensis]ORM68447.1 hypothetical protein HA51_14910 [Pantoea rwandensis]